MHAYNAHICMYIHTCIYACILSMYKLIHIQTTQQTNKHNHIQYNIGLHEQEPHSVASLGSVYPGASGGSRGANPAMPPLKLAMEFPPLRGRMTNECRVNVPN